VLLSQQTVPFAQLRFVSLSQSAAAAASQPALSASGYFLVVWFIAIFTVIVPFYVETLGTLIFAESALLLRLISRCCLGRPQPDVSGPWRQQQRSVWRRRRRGGGLLCVDPVPR
jgi:hypothetical protein